jgi:hypothetical protein
MAEKPKSEIISPSKPKDTDDIERLFLDDKLGDSLTTTTWHSIAVGKPKDFFRVHPDRGYRRRLEMLILKKEDQVEQEYYVIDPAMKGRLAKARPCLLLTCIYRNGEPRLWPIPEPREGEKDNRAWISARAAARVALQKWTSLVWVGRAYKTQDAQPGYAPEPDWSKLPDYFALVNTGLGGFGIIRDEEHAVFRDQAGYAPTADGADGDDL